MPAWTNLWPVEVGRIQEGSQTVVFNHTPFEVVESTSEGVILKALQENPDGGYGEGSMVHLTPDTIVIYDVNKEGNVGNPERR